MKAQLITLYMGDSGRPFLCPFPKIFRGLRPLLAGLIALVGCTQICGFLRFSEKRDLIFLKNT